MLKNTKLGVALTTLALTVALGATSVFAAGTYVDYIPADEDTLADTSVYEKRTVETGTVEAVLEDGKLVITNNGGAYPDLLIKIPEQFDASKKVILDYDFTIEGGFGNLAMKTGEASDTSPEFKLGTYVKNGTVGDLDANTYTGTIDLTDEAEMAKAGAKAEGFVADGTIDLATVSIFAIGDGCKITVRKLAIYEEGAQPGGNEPTETQKPTDSSKPTDTTKPGNNQTSDAAMALPLVIAAAAAFGGIKLRKSK